MPGGLYKGEVVTKPAELVEAELVIELCDRWHKLPEEIQSMDVTGLRLLKIYSFAQEQKKAKEDTDESEQSSN